MSILQAVLILFTLGHSPSSPGPTASLTQTDWERRFRDEYPVAVKRLRSQYSQVHGSAKSIHERTRKGQVSTQTNRVEFFFDSDYAKLVTYKSDNQPGNSREPYSRISCATPAYGFTAERKEESSAPTLKNLSAGTGGGLAERLVESKQEMIEAPFAVFMGPLDKVLFASANHILRVTPLTRRNREFVKVEFTAVLSSAESSTTTDCFVILEPGAGWVMHEFELVSGKSKRITTVDYRPASEGPLIPKSVIHASTSTRTIYEFDDFTFGPSPVGEFTLRAAGLPEIAATGIKASRNSASYLLIGAGLVAALAAIILTIYSRRRWASA